LTRRGFLLYKWPVRFYVYELVRQSDGKVIYVGKGSGRRLHFHKWAVATKRSTHQPKLYSQLSALVEAGDDFSARKVFESEDEAAVLQKELVAIAHYGIDTLLNGVSAHLFGAITTEKAVAVRKAISRARKGMKFSAEHCKAISDAQRGRKQYPEWVAASAAARVGKKRGPYKNTLPTEERRTRRLAVYKRSYQKRRLKILKNLKEKRDLARMVIKA
jgi:hypothetical protein